MFQLQLFWTASLCSLKQKTKRTILPVPRQKGQTVGHTFFSLKHTNETKQKTEVTRMPGGHGGWSGRLHSRELGVSRGSKGCCRCCPGDSHWERKATAVSRSSTNSAAVASILAREKSLIGSPSTTFQFLSCAENRVSILVLPPGLMERASALLTRAFFAPMSYFGGMFDHFQGNLIKYWTIPCFIYAL